ncbi:TonB-dependent receptor [Methylosinus sporium]|nr:TonB-dependent receptor [Methylosinus sporium]
MRLRRNGRKWVAAGFGLLFVDASSTCAEPRAASEQTVVPDVVVGSSGRGPDVQKTPAAVTRFDSRKIENLNIANTRDLAGYVPGLTQFRSAVTASNSNYFFRGIGEYDPQGTPSVGVYLDDAYFPRLLGSQIDLLDVERIEARPGPQDTNAPHNAEAGVIQIITRKPDNTLRLIGEAGYGNYNERKFSVLGSGPIIDDELFGSISYSHRERDGTVRNLVTNNRGNNIDLNTVLGKLRWTPTEQLEVQLQIDGEFDNGQTKSYNNRSIAGNSSSTAFYPLYPYNDFSQVGGALSIGYRIDNNLNLKSITQFRYFDQVALYDNTSDLWARNSNWLHYWDRNYSQEIRLNGEYDQLDFRVAGYFNHDEWFSGRRANAYNPATTTNYFADPQVATTYLPNMQELWQITNTYAIYGEGNYHFTDALRLTLGGRINYQEQWNNDYNYSLVNGQTSSSLAGGAFTTTDPFAAFYNPRGVLNWSVRDKAGWLTGSPKVVLSYQATPELQLYASFSQGTKDGGFDMRAQGPTIASVTQASIPYRPEKLSTYEFGFKSSWFDSRLIFNAAAFWNDIQNVQATALDPTTNTTHRFSAGHGRSNGVELQATVRPNDDLEIGATGSYLDALLDYYAGTTTYAVLANSPFGANYVYPTAAHSGSRLPYSPKFQGSINATYRIPVDLPGTFKISGSVQAQTSYYTDIINNPIVKIAPQAFVNLFGSYTTPDDHWTFKLAVNNLFDRRFAQNYTYQPITKGTGLGQPAYWAVGYNDPRSIVGSIRYAF